MNCKERNFELIESITAYSESGISFTHPIQVFKKYLESSDYSISDSSPVDIPMKVSSGKLEDSSKEGLQGTVYTVSLTWEVDNPDKTAYTKLGELKKSCKHLIVTTFGGNKAMIRSTEDGWLFSMEESGGAIKCDLSVMNTSGIQRILE